MAFQKTRAWSDVEATFTIRLNSFRADQGLIVRAQDATRYCLIHFPQSGQQYRAQHFWAALSVADGSGYLRVRKLALVPRVASNPFGLEHQARVKVTGNRFQVWVNGDPALDEIDDTWQQGRVGLSGFVSFAHGQVRVSGTEVTAPPWDDTVPKVNNWFTPFPEAPTKQLRGSGASGQRRRTVFLRDRNRDLRFFQQGMVSGAVHGRGENLDGRARAAESGGRRRTSAR